MSDRFGPVAARLSGQMALLLGWPPAQFWSATPTELVSVLTAATPPAGAAPSRETINALLERENDG